MGSARATWRDGLRAADDREAFLLANSALPGPRGNLELLDAAGDVLTLEEALRFALLGPAETPPDSGREYLPCCGLVALGRVVSEASAAGQQRPEPALLDVLRAAANDPRWRVREAVAIALQRWGDADLPAMHAVAMEWTSGTLLEARASVAAVCEPRLLPSPEATARATAVLFAATRSFAMAPTPRGEPGRVLGAALGYGWSVAVAADRTIALPQFEHWVYADEPDMRRMMRENLTKARFIKAVPDAIDRLRTEIG